MTYTEEERAYDLRMLEIEYAQLRASTAYGLKPATASFVSYATIRFTHLLGRWSQPAYDDVTFDV